MLSSLKKVFQLFRQALRGEEQDYTQGNINRAIFLLAIPMVLEMSMESLFAVVDIYFVSQLHNDDAVAAVGLTESVMAIFYAIAMGLSMGTTAIVARRAGEKNLHGLSHAAVQSIYIAIIVSCLVAVIGGIYYKDFLELMGATPKVIEVGSSYTFWMLMGNLSVMLLFVNNAIFRGAGRAVIAMHALWIANGINMILDPLLIFGWGPIPAYGVEGAAYATNMGRSIGVLFQLYFLLKGTALISIGKKSLQISFALMMSVLKISGGGAAQFFISSVSWLALTKIVASFGSEAVAGYTIAIRILIFSILPAWGVANAAATLVGQNLGARQPERAEASVWRAGLGNLGYMLSVMVIYLFFADTLMGFFSKNPAVIRNGSDCLKIFAISYGLYGYGMILLQAFNGAGDTRTPLILNFIGFWCLQIPLAYFLAFTAAWGTQGVYFAVVIAESLVAIVSIHLFRKGRWKTNQLPAVVENP